MIWRSTTTSPRFICANFTRHLSATGSTRSYGHVRKLRWEVLHNGFEDSPFNTKDLAIEILLDKPVAKAREALREGPGKLVFGTRPASPRQIRPLEDMVVIDEVDYGPHTIRQYESGIIEVLTGGVPVPVAKPVLREIADEIKIDLLNGAGSRKNTRQRGDHIIKKVRNLAGSGAQDVDNAASFISVERG